jgi:hypothetical protein
MAIYFVDGATGDDTNDGLDQAGAALATATWTAATRTLTQVAHGYTFVASDVIRITGGAGATVGNYEVESATANTIVLKATTTLPGVSAGTALAVGDLTDEDITSATGPFVTIQKAADTLAAGDTVWVRSGTYNELVTMSIAGTNVLRVRFEGYASAIGDRAARPVIDGESSRANCITCAAVIHYYDLVSLELKRATSHGLAVISGVVGWHMEDVLAHTNGSSGLNGVSTQHSLVRCETYSNTVRGINFAGGNHFGCYSHDEPSGMFITSVGTAVECIADTCPTSGFDLFAGSATGTLANCTAYNCGTGVRLATTSSSVVLLGCILSSCTTGINAQGSHFINVIDRCVFHNNGTDVHENVIVLGRGSGNAAKGPGCISADPGFVDPANGNFTPTSDAVREAAAFTFLGTGVSGVSRTFLWPGAVQPKPTPRRVPSIGMAGRR